MHSNINYEYERDMDNFIRRFLDICSEVNYCQKLPRNCLCLFELFIKHTIINSLKY